MTREQYAEIGEAIEEADIIKHILDTSISKHNDFILRVANYTTTLTIEIGTELHAVIAKKLAIELENKEAIIANA